jgi:hypothetical protein
MVDTFGDLFGMKVQLWNPFEYLEVMQPLADELLHHKYRFAAAIGAAVGGLLEE